MRRISPALIAVIVVVCALALFVIFAHPVIALPAVTVALPASVTNAIPGLANVKALTVTVRTNGALSVGLDGQTLTTLSYTPDSLGAASNLAMRTALPSSDLTLLFLIPVLLFPWISPQLVWSALITGISLYYVLPVEVTLRFIHG
ncbi:MAG: hypothetical protein M1132_07505 [Chloroflexi bacterium]|nr:hypothetical protein [Chloroflexota bacterium]